jgi:hypothetical protein
MKFNHKARCWILVRAAAKCYSICKISSKDRILFNRCINLLKQLIITAESLQGSLDDSTIRKMTDCSDALWNFFIVFIDERALKSKHRMFIAFALFRQTFMVYLEGLNGKAKNYPNVVHQIKTWEESFEALQKEIPFK